MPLKRLFMVIYGECQEAVAALWRALVTKGYKSRVLSRPASCSTQPPPNNNPGPSDAKKIGFADPSLAAACSAKCNAVPQVDEPRFPESRATSGNRDASPLRARRSRRTATPHAPRRCPETVRFRPRRHTPATRCPPAAAIFPAACQRPGPRLRMPRCVNRGSLPNPQCTRCVPGCFCLARSRH